MPTILLEVIILDGIDVFEVDVRLGQTIINQLIINIERALQSLTIKWVVERRSLIL